MKTRKESEKLLEEYIENEALRHHCKMVAQAMEAYAKHLGKSEQEIDIWWTAGLLHDLDWEKFPDEHPNKAVNEILPELGYPEEILDAIRAHAPGRTGKNADRDIERYLFACDELCGFIHASSLIRPEGYKGMKVKSIKKKLNTARFAANVSREDIAEGADLINSTLEEHIQFLLNVFV